MQNLKTVPLNSILQIKHPTHLPNGAAKKSSTTFHSPQVGRECSNEYLPGDEGTREGYLARSSFHDIHVLVTADGVPYEWHQDVQAQACAVHVPVHGDLVNFPFSCLLLIYLLNVVLLNDVVVASVTLLRGS